MTKPRAQLVNTADTPYYHCICRCVRRAYLCGEDQFTGRNYDHRKQWLVDRIKTLSSIFAIDICAYAVMSNHYHLIVAINDKTAAEWDEDEIIARWIQLFRSPSVIQRYQRKEQLSQLELKFANHIIGGWRKRLADLSWFMRCLNEPIARDANQEDECTGRFWEGRFKSQALRTNTALLNCMVYVDLNPIRAGVAQTLEDSDFTSIQERLFAATEQPQAILSSADQSTPAIEIDYPQPKTLVPFIGNERLDSDTIGIHFSAKDYFELIDWTGRIIREDKFGAIPKHIAPILLQLRTDAETWIERAKTNRRKRFFPIINQIAA